MFAAVEIKVLRDVCSCGDESSKWNCRCKRFQYTDQELSNV